MAIPSWYHRPSWRQIRQGVTRALPLVSMVGCATPPPEPKATTEVTTHYVLEQAPVKEHQKPFPQEIPIMVKWYAGDAFIEEHLGYQGWDFNRDGQIDMLEVLDQDGAVQAKVYDFNFDGQVDRVVRKRANN